MSQSSEKGVSLEKEIAKILRKKLGASVERDKRSGAGEINKSDMSDWFRQIPLFIEAKNQKTIKIKDWFRQAEGNASQGQSSTVVFVADDEVLACLRFSDLVDFLVEIRDQKAEIADLRTPFLVIDEAATGVVREGGVLVKKAHHECREGHMADEFGYCQQKGCRFSHGYKINKKGKSTK